MEVFVLWAISICVAYIIGYYNGEAGLRRLVEKMRQGG